jgi:uncharacterized membrane protein
MKILYQVSAISALLALGSCASSPQIYPNEKLQKVGKEGAARDVKECTALADDYVSGKGKQVASGAGSGAAVGGATGAVAGIFSHNLLGGALFGSALGAAAGGASGAVSPNQAKHNFIDHCLAERGYKVVGWD